MIGICDSDLGGLTVVRWIKKYLPAHDLIYCADTARAPYDRRDPATVVRRTRQTVEFLHSRGARLIVVVCHTMAGMGIAPPAAGLDTPVLDVVASAVESALEGRRRPRLGVVSTGSALANGVYVREIRRRCPEARIFSRACPLLVPLVEENWLKRPETAMIVKKCLHPLKMRQIDTLILGAAHYAQLRKVFERKIGRRVRVIDPARSLARRVSDYFSRQPGVESHPDRRGALRCLVTERRPQDSVMARRFMGQNIELQSVVL